MTALISLSSLEATKRGREGLSISVLFCPLTVGARSRPVAEGESGDLTYLGDERQAKQERYQTAQSTDKCREEVREFDKQLPSGV